MDGRQPDGTVGVEACRDLTGLTTRFATSSFPQAHNTMTSIEANNNKPSVMNTTGGDFIPESIGESGFGDKNYSSVFKKMEEQWFNTEPVVEETLKVPVNIKKEGDKLNDILGDMVSMALGKPQKTDNVVAIQDARTDEDTVEATAASEKEEEGVEELSK
jgi:hypothetical protein